MIYLDMLIFLWSPYYGVTKSMNQIVEEMYKLELVYWFGWGILDNALSMIAFLIFHYHKREDPKKLRKGKFVSLIPWNV